ncbi:hypothetical protein [Paraburkholderia sp. SIMBA_054]|uniref:hypothetical protein n=1 Tax=Paraburkholderia sp. SIMBA_054 TaxID=3085795 RepID=UPI00397A87E8
MNQHIPNASALPTGAAATTISAAVTEFLQLLARADSVVADSPALRSWDITDPTGDPANEVVRFSWIGDESSTYGFALTEGSITEGTWNGSSFFCLDSEGDQVQISLYRDDALVPERLAAGLQHRYSIGTQIVDAGGQILGRLSGVSNEQGAFWGTVDACFKVNLSGSAEVLDLTGHDRAQNPALDASYLRLTEAASPKSVVYVIFSQSEAEASTIREGFWSNANGWGDYADATKFSRLERDSLNLPESAGRDAQWVDYNRLKPFIDAQDRRAKHA